MKNQIFICAYLLLGTIHLGAQTPETQNFFDLLYRPDSLVEVSLLCDWDTLLSVRNLDREIDGTFFFQKRNKQVSEWDVNISVRGKYRRRICDLPPIKLDFSKKDFEEKGLLPFDKMKLVTHCLEDPDCDDRVLREYLLYRMYQLLSPHAFRTQLVQMNYAEANTTSAFPTHYGILIEDDKILAHRLGLDLTDTLGLSAQDFPGYQEEVHALFQYLIGNADWVLKIARNLDILKDNSSGQFFIVPYDFDFSGFVNAYYAIPNPDYKLKNVQQRVYLGESPPSDRAREIILAQKKAFFKMIRKCRFLSKEAKYECISYLSEGFRDIKRNKLAFPEP